MKEPVGAQIWSLRKRMQANPEMVLESLASTGYAYIEPAGFDPLSGTIQGLPIRELRRMAGLQGLKIPSVHINFRPEDIHVVCETAVALGAEYLVLPALRKELLEDPEGYRRAADELNEAGETAAIYGIRLAYHNHAQDLEAGPDQQLPLDFLLQSTQPEHVSFQADLGWIHTAGKAATDYFNRFPGRFPLWHIRDIAPENNESTVIGTGQVPFESIFAAKQQAGLRYAFVEMSSAATDPLQQLIESFPALRFS